MKAPAVNVVKMPDNVGFVEGAFIEPITVALHGLYLMDFKPMTTVAITGMGTIGLLTLQCAKIMGAREITVFDIDDSRLETAKKLGATHTINTMTDDVAERVKEISKGKGFEMVIETAGVPVTEMLCLEIAGNKGAVMFIGTPHVPFTIEPKQFEYINRKELMVRGSWMSYSAPYPGKEWTMAAHYLGTGEIKVNELIDRTISVEEMWGAFLAIEAREVAGKVIVEL